MKNKFIPFEDRKTWVYIVSTKHESYGYLSSICR